MRCFSLLLGARNTPAAGQTFSRADDELIRAITLRHFPDGFTILNAAGGWYDSRTGRFIEEDARQVLVCAPNSARIRPWCVELAGALQQEELLVVEVGPATSFRAPRRPDRRKRR